MAFVSSFWLLHPTPSYGVTSSLGSVTSWRAAGDHGRQSSVRTSGEDRFAFQSLADEAHDAWQPAYQALEGWQRSRKAFTWMSTYSNHTIFVTR